MSNSGPHLRGFDAASALLAVDRRQWGRLLVALAGDRPQAEECFAELMAGGTTLGWVPPAGADLGEDLAEGRGE